MKWLGKTLKMCIKVVLGSPNLCIRKANMQDGSITAQTARQAWLHCPTPHAGSLITTRLGYIVTCVASGFLSKILSCRLGCETKSGMESLGFRQTLFCPILTVQALCKGQHSILI